MKKILMICATLAIFWIANQIPGKPSIYSTFFHSDTAQATPTTTAPPQWQRTVTHTQSTVCANSRTGEAYTGVLISRDEVAAYASKYWSGQNLEIALAVTVKEGQRDLNCVGDEGSRYYGKPTSDGRHYGYSVGLYQWRTIIEQTGKGGCEDATWQLGDVERQTQCAFDKWNVHQSWRPWSAYTSGRYRLSLGK